MVGNTRAVPDAGNPEVKKAGLVQAHQSTNQVDDHACYQDLEAFENQEQFDREDRVDHEEAVGHASEHLGTRQCDEDSVALQLC